MKKLLIYANSKLSVILVDSDVNTKIQAREDLTNYVSIGAADRNSLHYVAEYIIKIKIKDSRIQHGSNCIDYKATGTSYKECVEQSLQEQFEEWF